MADAINSMADRWRGERRDMERRMSDGRRRRLREKLDSTHEELEREREARRALAEVLEKIDHRRRSRGFLRLVIIGGGAYLLGSRAGRERYDQVMAKVGEARQSLMQRMEDMRSKAMETAQKVPDAVTEATQSFRTGDQGASSTGSQGSSTGSRGSSSSTAASQGVGAGTSASTIGHTPTPSTGSTGSSTTSSSRSEDV
jgi:prefoldin subunit 5